MIPETCQRGGERDYGEQQGSQMNMNHQPAWVWKQRSAVTRFLIAFYLRRTLRFICIRLPFMTCGRMSYGGTTPLPTRRRQTGINTKSN